MMESVIMHVFGTIYASEVFGPYRISIVRNTQEQHAVCSIGECVTVLEVFRVVAIEGFGVEMDLEGPDGVRGRVYNMDLLAIIHDDNEIFGFASAKIHKDLDLLYLDGIAVKKSFQARGVGRILIEALLKQQPQKRMAFVTQNPVMYCVLRRLFERTYPFPGQRIVPSNLQYIGIVLRTNHDGTFNPYSFVIDDLFTQCLYAAIPESNDPVVNAWFQEALGIQAGITRNGFLFIGEDMIGK